MKVNIGVTDRIIRGLTALMLLVLITNQVFSGVGGLVISIIAAVFSLTSVFGICPLYTVLGINTIHKK